MTEMTNVVSHWRTRIAAQRWMTWMDEHRWFWALASLMVLRIVISALFVIGIPRLESHMWFYFHHGGDQDYYFEHGLALAYGPLDYFAINIGTPAIMALLIRLTGATSYVGILTPMVLINGFLLGSLSVALMGLLARRVFNAASLGLLAAGLWAAAPWLLYAVFGLHPQAAWVRAPYVPALAWLNMNSDGPAIFFTLLGTWLLWEAVDEGRNWDAFWAGLAYGIAVLFRVHMAAPIAFTFVLVMSQRKQWRMALLTATGSFLGYLPQVIYNWFAALAEGRPDINPFLPGYLYFGYIGSGGIGRIDPNVSSAWKPLALTHLVQSLQRYLLTQRPLILVGFAAVILAAVPFAALWRARGARIALFTFLTGPFVIGIAAASSAFTDDPFRFSMPGLPYLLLGAVWIIAWSYAQLCAFGNRKKGP